jgi:hypothetical protein
VLRPTTKRPQACTMARLEWLCPWHYRVAPQ